MKKQFKHFKGEIYTFIAVAKHTETNEELVIYSNNKGDIFARPYQMFFDKVIVNGKEVTRFEETK